MLERAANLIAFLINGDSVLEKIEISNLASELSYNTNVFPGQGAAHRLIAVSRVEGKKEKTSIVDVVESVEMCVNSELAESYPQFNRLFGCQEAGRQEDFRKKTNLCHPCQQDF